MKKAKITISVLCIILVVCAAHTGVKIYKANTGKILIHSSGIIANMDVPDLILNSDLIIEGTVQEFSDSKWSNSDFKRGKEIRNILQTDVIINVDNVLFGEDKNKQVTVRIDGGEDKTTIYTNSESPEFKKGENVLLFLCRSDSDVATDEDYYVVVGCLQGKYTMDKASKNQSSYSNEKGTLNVAELTKQIFEVKASNPNYKEEQLEKRKEVEERNKALFGE